MTGVTTFEVLIYSSTVIRRPNTPSALSEQGTGDSELRS